MKKLTVDDIPMCGEYGRCYSFNLAQGYRAEVTIYEDNDMAPPWLAHDGHGEVTGWEQRDKHPGELVLDEDHDSKRFYDFAGAVAIAKRDGWDAPPYNTGTPGERAERAARRDFEFLRAWCRGEWHWVGVEVALYREGVRVAHDSLWGMDSANDYPRQHAAETLNGMIADDIKARRQASAAKGRETRERAYWAARGVLTVQS